MSQEFSVQETGERDISPIGTERNYEKNYSWFEGMNYEQFRQPYTPEFNNRNNTTGKRKDGKRPDES